MIYLELQKRAGQFRTSLLHFQSPGVPQLRDFDGPAEIYLQRKLPPFELLVPLYNDLRLVCDFYLAVFNSVTSRFCYLTSSKFLIT